ncbi:MAG TPA: phosphate ABC transporter permease subunit PstC [Thermodesulfobacteriota bacterium]|nr:phosphate ABC transporter permease subunit PstC [Thermodesulfobacteriota bacterium]
MWREKFLEKFLERGFLVIALSSISILALIAFFIFEQGVPLIWKIGLKSFLLGGRWYPSHQQFGILPMIVGSFWVTLGSLVVGVPLGLACAIFLSELVPPTLAMALRPTIQLLAAIPSVIFGFWGLIVLVPLIRVYMGGPGLSILAGSLVLGLMILPTIISISEDSLRALPRTYKEGAFSLGATHWQTIWRVLLPAARSGIVASVILGMGRAIGETMAMIMILGNAVQMPNSILNSARTLTTNIGIEMGYASGDHQKALFATGVVLFFIIMALNSLALFVARKGRG